jgi:predicted porin
LYSGNWIAPSSSEVGKVIGPMRRLRSFALTFTPAALLLAVALTPGRAKADITLVDHDGWSFYTTGLVGAHYQLLKGDQDPPTGGKSLAGGKILDENSANDMRDGTITLSDIRSGFIGTQIGFGVNRQINQNVHIESLLSISMEGINSNRGQNLQKDVDYREGWAAIVSKWGTLKFGRMFGMFGEGSAEVMLMAWRYGVGHPCVINSATISCGSAGAGPVYPGFDAAIRYISPRFAGFQVAVSVADPIVGVGLKMSPQPRIDGEVNFDQAFGPLRLRLIGQSMWDQIAQSTAPTGGMPGTIKADTIWGAMGTGIATIAFGSGALTLGGGGWTGKGVGERIPLQADDPANPISFDATLDLRTFVGVYGNAQLEFMGHSVTFGGGQLKVTPTPYDDSTMTNALPLLQNAEYHVTYHYKWDAIVFNVEYMHWTSDWHQDLSMPMLAPPHQALNFMGGGISYVW